MRASRQQHAYAAAFAQATRMHLSVGLAARANDKHLTGALLTDLTLVSWLTIVMI